MSTATRRLILGLRVFLRGGAAVRKARIHRANRAGLFGSRQAAAKRWRMELKALAKEALPRDQKRERPTTKSPYYSG